MRLLMLWRPLGACRKGGSSLSILTEVVVRGGLRRLMLRLRRVRVHRSTGAAEQPRGRA